MAAASFNPQQPPIMDPMDVDPRSSVGPLNGADTDSTLSSDRERSSTPPPHLRNDDELPPPFYRPAQQLPYELATHCSVLLESGQYIEGFALLHDLLRQKASISSPSDPHPALVPPVQIFELAATLIVHPAVTTRAKTSEKLRGANQAISYLYAVNGIIGPVNAKFNQALTFATPGSGRGRSGRKRRNSADGVDSERPVKSSIANDAGLWAQADDFWKVVGWAFNCSVKHEKRWARWRIWLDLMLDIIEADWTERCRLQKDIINQDNVADDELLEQSIIAMHLSSVNASGFSGRRKVLRAILADGSAKSLSEFPEVFKNELKERKEETPKPNKEVGDLGGDDDDDDDLSGAEKETTTTIPTRASTRAAAARRGSIASLHDGSSDDGQDEADLNGADMLGGMEAVELRQRFLALLTTVAQDISVHFTTREQLFDSFTEHLRPLHILPFQTLLTTSRLSVSAQCILAANTLLPLLPNSPPTYNFDAPTQYEWSVHFFPEHANTHGYQDNAKVSVLLETVLQLQLPGFKATKRFQDSVHRGIEARNAKAMGLGKSGGGGLKAGELTAKNILEASAKMLALQVHWLKDDTDADPDAKQRILCGSNSMQQAQHAIDFSSSDEQSELSDAPSDLGDTPSDLDETSSDALVGRVGKLDVRNGKKKSIREEREGTGISEPDRYNQQLNDLSQYSPDEQLNAISKYSSDDMSKMLAAFKNIFGEATQSHGNEAAASRDDGRDDDVEMVDAEIFGDEETVEQPAYAQSAYTQPALTYPALTPPAHTHPVLTQPALTQSEDMDDNPIDDAAELIDTQLIDSEEAVGEPVTRNDDGGSSVAEKTGEPSNLNNSAPSSSGLKLRLRPRHDDYGLGGNVRDEDEAEDASMYKDGKERPFVCSDCDKRYCHNRSLLQHQREHGHSGLRAERKKKDVEEEKGETGENRDEAELADENPFVCCDCGNKYNSKRSLLWHQHHLGHGGFEAEARTEGSFFACFGCEKKYHHRRSLLRHQRLTGHSGIVADADEMEGDEVEGDEVDEDEVEEDVGEAGPADDKPFECPDCDKRYKYNHGLLRHQRQHGHGYGRGGSEVEETVDKSSGEFTGRKSSTCSDCGKTFSSHWHMKRHQRENCKSRVVEAEAEAEEAKAEEADVVRTGMEGKDKKTSTCPDCGNALSSHSNVMRHQRESCKNRAGGRMEAAAEATVEAEVGVERTPEKTYRCGDCGEGFSRMNHLNRHVCNDGKEGGAVGEAAKTTGDDLMRLERPIVCESCGRRFTEKRKLTTHQTSFCKGRRVESATEEVAEAAEVAETQDTGGWSARLRGVSGRA